VNSNVHYVLRQSGVESRNVAMGQPEGRPMKTRIQKHALVASCALVRTFLFPGTTAATEWVVV
jgi:hypothetical protein